MHTLEFESGERLKLIDYTVVEMRQRARIEDAWLFSPIGDVMHTPSWA